MTEIKSETTLLQWKLLTKKRAGITRGLPPGKEHLAWVSNTVTLIYGRRDAVLVDTFLTAAHAKELIDWVAASGKNLVTIYITHAHGDHYFGLKSLLDHFPNAKAIATAKVVNAMHEQVAPQFVKSYWESRFPGQIPEGLVAAEVLEGSEFELEGKKLVVEEAGHTDTANTTSLYIPSLDLVVAGDVVYNGVHPYLTELTKQTRLEWIAALDKIEALHPRAVIAGHKVPENDDDPRNIDETRQYIRDFISLDESTRTARELYDKMLELYPNRVNPGSLWGSANAAKSS
jgi:glyoxylase-like metal-dependent hydrolase (beta-lactamase superfamily II)